MYILQVVSTIFWIWNGISFLFPIAFCQNAMVPTLFRKIGSIAETVSYAHLHLKIDLADILKIHRDALMTANQTLALISKHIGLDDALRLAPFFESLERSFEPTENLMEVILLIFNPHTNSNTLAALANLTKVKRQLGLAFVGVATLFNCGLSIYNTYEIEQLKQATNHLEDGINRIITVLREEDKSMETLKSSITAINDTLIIFGKNLKKLREEVDLISAYSLIHSKVEASNQEFTLFSLGLLELLNGRFSPLLVNKAKVLITFENFRTKILKEGYHLVFDFPSSIFKADISYVVENGILDVFVHCPIVQLSPIPVYQYLGLPIIINETKTGPLLFVEPREGYDLLMIDTQTQRGAEFHSSFLTGCQTARLAIGLVYLCSDDLPILKRDTTSDCLGLLFSGKLSQESLLKACKLSFSSKSVYTRQIDRNNFLVYSSTATKLTIFCDRTGKTNITYIQGISMIEVPAGCQADLDGSLMYGRQSGITFEGSNLIHLPSHLTFTNDFFPVTQLMDVYNTLTSVRLPEKVDFRELDEYARDQNWRSAASTIVTIGYALLLMIVGAVVTYLCYIYCSYRRAQQPTIAGNEADQQVVEHIELLGH